MSRAVPRGWRRAGRVVLVLAFLPGSGVAAPPRFEWSSAAAAYFQGDAKGLAEAAPSRAICARVAGAEPPAADRPTAAQAQRLDGCGSEALLFGIGRAADPVAARHCAILERDAEDDGGLPYFSGSGILAVVYANGEGVARDLAVATHMACGIDDAAAATESRVAHLRTLEGSDPGRAAFGICDDATSGASGGVCAAHDAAVQDQARAGVLAGMERGWSGARRAAFGRVLASARAYAEDAHALDCFGGTGAAGCAISGAQGDLDRFLARVRALVTHGPRPAGTSRPDGGNAATDPAAWNRLVASVDGGERATYLANGRAVVAARARFERDLLGFAATVPGTTPHDTRALFADF